MKHLLFIFSLAANLSVMAQEASFAKHQTAAVPAANPTLLNQAKNAIQAGFVSSNIRFRLDAKAKPALQNSVILTAWKGEKVHTQFAVWSGVDADQLRVTVSDLQSIARRRILQTNISAGPVGYVWTDEFGEGCGNRKTQDFDSALVADPIDYTTGSFKLKKDTAQPVWISIQVPTETPAGTYTGKVTLNASQKRTFPLTINVINKVLPPSSQWSFNLDLWQHPAAITRVHGVPLWSEAHFTAMKPYFTMLARAGQKNITASIVNEPWGHQTYDDFPSLIRWTKKKDGTWQYDYSLFDRYVSFVMSCGIRQRINCYSMVPWKIAFSYLDETLGRDTVFTGSIGTPAYNAFWKTMLVDFTRHLKTKGWFGITAIAMDERPMPAMRAVIQLLKEVDKDWKIALAGDYHPEIEPDVWDYSTASRLQFPTDTLELRQRQGKHSTWYTSCVENFPNGFTFSPSAEHVWIGWYTAAKNMDGYLRWAYNSWPANPIRDSRFTSWPAGDTYQVYPGPRTSIRFEKLVEGIQDYEKVRILKEDYRCTGDHKSLQVLETAISRFEIKALEKQTAAEMVQQAKGLLNR